MPDGDGSSMSPFPHLAFRTQPSAMHGKQLSFNADGSNAERIDICSYSRHPISNQHNDGLIVIALTKVRKRRDIIEQMID